MTKSFHTVYNHLRPVSPHGGVSMTDQQYLKDCDINTILRKFAVTGQAPTLPHTCITGDFSEVGDFRDCLERITRAQGEFEALPSDIRSRFGNDPSVYVDFVLNPANIDECVKLGLRVKPEAVPETSVDVLKRIEKKIVTPKEEKTV